MSLKWIVLIGTPIWILFLLDFFLREYPNAMKEIDETDNQTNQEKIETRIALQVIQLVGLTIALIIGLCVWLLTGDSA